MIEYWMLKVMCTKKRYTTDPDLLAKEVEIEFIRSSGPGGRHRDTSETGSLTQLLVCNHSSGGVSVDHNI